MSEFFYALLIIIEKSTEKIEYIQNAERNSAGLNPSI